MTTFRKTLMATTVLAGFAIFALDAAQAGPNGGPSLGSISGFSSMRMDFNRVGGPNRALSRDHTRVVPLDVKKTEKPKDTKNAAKKGTDIARVSNPKSAGGGKGKEVVSAPALQIPAPLAELYRVTGGNLDDISQLAELASWLKTGLPVLGSPLFPGKGDGSFVPPTLGATDRLPWGDAASGPGNNTPQRIEDPSAQASGGWLVWTREQTTRTENDVTYTRTVITSRWVEDDGSFGHNDAGTEFVTEDSTEGSDGSRVRTTTHDGPGGHEVLTDKWFVFALSPSNSTNDETTPDQKSDDKPKPEKADSQPTEEGTGRPRGMHTVRCDIAGCIDYGMKDGRRTNPGHGNTEGSDDASGGGGGLPSWATDPCPDCSGRGSGGGGFRRPGGSDLGWRGHGEESEEGGFAPVAEPHR